MSLEVGTILLGLRVPVKWLEAGLQVGIGIPASRNWDSIWGSVMLVFGAGLM